jgi:hypothetical protein
MGAKKNKKSLLKTGFLLQKRVGGVIRPPERRKNDEHKLSRY